MKLCVQRTLHIAILVIPNQFFLYPRYFIMVNPNSLAIPTTFWETPGVFADEFTLHQVHQWVMSVSVMKFCVQCSGMTSCLRISHAKPTLCAFSPEWDGWLPRAKSTHSGQYLRFEKPTLHGMFHIIFTITLYNTHKLCHFRLFLLKNFIANYPQSVEKPSIF